MTTRTAAAFARLSAPHHIDPRAGDTTPCGECGKHPRHCWCPPPWDRRSYHSPRARLARARHALSRITGGTR